MTRLLQGMEREGMFAGNGRNSGTLADETFPVRTVVLTDPLRVSRKRPITEDRPCNAATPG